MLTIRECTDLKKCEHIWRRVWPVESIFDLWEVRACFAGSYDRPARFLVAEEGGSIQGVLPLSWIAESRQFAFFPGETWKGKTWLEQNRIMARTPSVRSDLLSSIQGPVHIRYLCPGSVEGMDSAPDVDETGYLFFPAHYGNSFPNYMEQLPGKFRKNNAREASRLESFGISYRHDTVPDIDRLYRMNLDAFGEDSYFSDPRFLSAFEKLASWLMKNGLLRITTVIIGGETAAVDIGAVWNRRYTLLAGGTNPEFRGVAKLINFHHLERSCMENFHVVDFLCGDFGWKERFRLTPSPLYQVTRYPVDLQVSGDVSVPVMIGDECLSKTVGHAPVETLCR